LDFILETQPSEFGEQQRRTSISRRIERDEEVILTINRIKNTPLEDPIPLAGIVNIPSLVAEGASNLQIQKDQLKELLDNGDIDQEQYDTAIISYDKADNIRQLRSQLPTARAPQVLEFVPGRYSISGFIIKKGDPAFFIPEETRTYCGKFHGCPGGAGEESYVLPEQSPSSYPTGGGTFEIILTEEVLYNPNISTIVLYLYDTGVPKNWDEFMEMPNIDELTANYSHVMLPTFE